MNHPCTLFIKFALTAAICLAGQNFVNAQSSDSWKRGNVDSSKRDSVPASTASSYYENEWAGIQDDKMKSDDVSQDRELDTTRYEISLLSKPLELINVDIRDYSETKPDSRSIELLSNGYGEAYPRFFSPHSVNWCAAEIRYQPLYFEDVTLERYGQTAPQIFQPYFSATRFFASAALLPFNLRREHFESCDYPLGYCLPGNCTPSVKQRLLLD